VFQNGTNTIKIRETINDKFSTTIEFMDNSCVLTRVVGYLKYTC